MRIKEQFLTHEADGVSMLVPLGGAGFSGIVKGNRTLGVILQLLKNDTTEDAVVQAMCARFDAPEDVIRRDVERAVRELRAIGALEE